jgi:hypothetical protein
MILMPYGPRRVWPVLLVAESAMSVFHVNPTPSGVPQALGRLDIRAGCDYECPRAADSTAALSCYSPASRQRHRGSSGLTCVIAALPSRLLTVCFACWSVSLCVCTLMPAVTACTPQPPWPTSPERTFWYRGRSHPQGTTDNAAHLAANCTPSTPTMHWTTSNATNMHAQLCRQGRTLPAPKLLRWQPLARPRSQASMSGSPPWCMQAKCCMLGVLGCRCNRCMPPHISAVNLL